MTIKQTLVETAAAFVVFGLGFGAGVWYTNKPATPVGVAVEAKVAPEVKNVPQEAVPCKSVVVYNPEAKKALALPTAVQQNDRQVVTSAIGLKPDTRPHRVTSVFDLDTGKTTAYDTAMPLPWLTVDTHGEAGIYYGTRAGEKTVRFEARQALLDIKALKVSAIASYDKPVSGGAGSSFIGIGAAYRW